jgi:hypothetical protein
MKRNRVPRVAVDGGGHAGIDLVHEGIQASGRAVAVPAHVDPGAQSARRLFELHIVLADHRLAIVAPFLDEFLPALLLDVIVGRGGLGLGRHGAAGK